MSKSRRSRKKGLRRFPAIVSYEAKKRSSEEKSKVNMFWHLRLYLKDSAHAEPVKASLQSVELFFSFFTFNLSSYNTYHLFTLLTKY